MRPLIFLNRLAWLAVIAVLVFFVSAEVWPGQQTISVDPRHETRLTSAFGPPTRLDLAGAEAKIVAEPIYFDARLPVLAFQAVMRLELDVPAGVAPPKVGVVLAENSYRLYDLENQTATIDLRGVPRTDGGVRFVISAPGASSTTPFIVHRVSVTAERLTLQLILEQAIG